jgi:hypothetical protein
MQIAYEPIIADTALRKREACELWQHVVSQRPGYETCSLVPKGVVLEVEILGEATLFHRVEKHANTH